MRWGYCLEDCPSEEIRVACLDEPLFPVLVEDDGYYQNSTSSYIPGSGQTLLEFDFITYNCPEGYAFEDSKNATNYAICYNWEYVYPFDLTKPCVRKSKFTVCHKRTLIISKFFSIHLSMSTMVSRWNLARYLQLELTSSPIVHGK